MNQILSVDSTPKNNKRKKKNSGPIEINSILRFFAISILVFGICMTGSGSYSMYKDSQRLAVPSKPTIYVEENSETEITLRISHDKSLNKVTYSWNNETENFIDSYGNKKVEQKIEIPTGTNVLNVYASDVNGQEIKYQQTYTVEGDIGIEFEVVGNNIKIIANGANQLSYMTYRWDENEETKVDINDMTAEQTVEIPKGLHKLTVIVVDSENNTQTKEQEINGVTKPKVEIGLDESQENFLIKASDDQGLKRAEVIIDADKKYSFDLTVLEGADFEYLFKLHDGENKIEVTIYNMNDVQEKQRAKVNK